MIKLTRIRSGIGKAALLIILFLGFAVQADVIIVASDTPGYERGRILQDEDIIDLPSGLRITVLLSTNAIREIKGPVRQKVLDLSQGRPSTATSLWQQVVDFFGTGGVSTSPGAVRSMSIPDGNRPSWKAVPLDVGDTACAVYGQPVKASRKDTREVLEVRLSDANLTAIATMRFSPGQGESPWPPQVPVASGVYVLSIPGASAKRFTLKVLQPETLDGERVLENLAREGCKAQVKLWLEAAAAQ